jgi:streptogramin lyase
MPAFDAAAIAHFAAATRPGGRWVPSARAGWLSDWRWWALAILVALSAGTFVVAGAIRPSPTLTPWTPVPTLPTEVYAPGVALLTDDGAGHVLAEPFGYDHLEFAFGPDGAVWTLSSSGLVRLGVPDDHQIRMAAPHRDQGLPAYDLTAAPDGTLWVVTDRSVASFRDGAWTTAPDFPGQPMAIEILPDGQVWVGSLTKLARLDGDAWTAFPFQDERGGRYTVGSEPRDLVAAPDGSIWARASSGDRLLHFDGATWSSIAAPGGDGPDSIDLFSVGPGGEVWAFESEVPPPSCGHGKHVPGRLARYHGEAWSVSPHAAPRIQHEECYYGFTVADHDGRLWGTNGNYLEVYDGTAWTTVLDATTTQSPLSLAPDGSIWFHNDEGVFIVDAGR